jgi:hypothetical protein
MKIFKQADACIAALAAASMLIFAAGCEIDSSETASRNVGLDVTGYYSGTFSGRLVQQNTGASITGIDLRQNGDRLEGYDNNGIIFKGTIGSVTGQRASFTLEGRTTAGGSGVISGNINVSGTSGTMSGTWFEEALSSRVAGTASVSEPIAGLSISPASATLNSNGDTQTFTASGGDGSYTWSVSSSSAGSVSGTGASVTYTRNDSGSNTIRVNSGGETASASISQP